MEKKTEQLLIFKHTIVQLWFKIFASVFQFQKAPKLVSVSLSLFYSGNNCCRCSGSICFFKILNTVDNKALLFFF